MAVLEFRCGLSSDHRRKLGESHCSCLKCIHALTMDDLRLARAPTYVDGPWLNPPPSTERCRRSTPLVPARFRSDIPVVPVVRLSGVIGISTPLKPGLTLASVARSLERAFAMRNGARGRAGDQFAGRLGGAVAPDLPAHPRARRREEGAGHRLRRGCRARPAAT